MNIQSFFGSAQTDLGYQFYDAAGTLLGDRITDGISALPEPGAYSANAIVPEFAAGVFWSSNESQASEDLRDALPLDSAGRVLLASLNVVDDVPVAIVPAPSENPLLCRVFLYVNDLHGKPKAGVKVEIFLKEPAANSSWALRNSEGIEMLTNSDGFDQVDIQRTDGMSPAGSKYFVTSRELGLHDVPMELESPTFDLSTLIQ